MHNNSCRPQAGAKQGVNDHSLLTDLSCTHTHTPLSLVLSEVMWT